MLLVWLLAALTSRADGGCNFAHHQFGWTCDSLWETMQLSCADLVAANWDCSGCECPGDATLATPPSAPLKEQRTLEAGHPAGRVEECK